LFDIELNPMDMATINDQIAEPVVAAYMLLLNTSDLVARHADIHLSRLGVTLTRYCVLVTLEHCPRAPTLTELSQKLSRTKNSLTTVIDHMERDGLVRRVPDMADRRTIRIEITEKGRDLFESVRGPSRELVSQIMSCFSKEEVISLAQLLLKARASCPLPDAQKRGYSTSQIILLLKCRCKKDR
jgi:DNA-binding MarR family transcriptional regulator